MFFIGLLLIAGASITIVLVRKHQNPSPTLNQKIKESEQALKEVDRYIKSLEG